MKRYMNRKLVYLGLTVAAALTPAAAMADTYWFNDGNGTCGYVSCGPYGCQVLETFPCPKEVGDQ